MAERGRGECRMAGGRKRERERSRDELIPSEFNYVGWRNWVGHWRNQRDNVCHECKMRR